MLLAVYYFAVKLKYESDNDPTYDNNFLFALFLLQIGVHDYIVKMANK